MKIGLNGQRILIENPAGPEIYTINLYKSLARNDTKNKYVVYVPSQPSQEFIDDITNRNPNFEIKVVEKKRAWTQLDLVNEIKQNPIDIFYSPFHTIPFLLPKKIKIVSMIHGFEHETNKELRENSFKYWRIKKILEWTIKRSDKVIVPSNRTADKVAEVVNKDRIKVVYEGVDEQFRPRTDLETQDILKKYSLDNKKYFIFVSTIQPRKNIPNMIEAFSLAIKESPELAEYELVLSGKNGWNYQESLEAPKKYDVEDKVKFLGWTPQNDLPHLLAGAQGYVNFSVDEGFGLTLLEALASGIPAAVSNIPAHREVGGELPIYASPLEVNQIKTAITYLPKFSKDSQYQEKLTTWASKFNWNKTAQETIEVFETLVKK